MRVGKTVVDAIKTRGGDNTNYTLGQASDVMCMYRVMAFTLWLSLSNMSSCFRFLILHSTLGLALVGNAENEPFHCHKCRNSKFS